MNSFYTLQGLTLRGSRGPRPELLPLGENPLAPGEASELSFRELKLAPQKKYVSSWFLIIGSLLFWKSSRWTWKFESPGAVHSSWVKNLNVNPCTISITSVYTLDNFKERVSTKLLLVPFISVHRVYMCTVLVSKGDPLLLANWVRFLKSILA